MADTYDLNTDIGKMRLLAQDTNLSSPALSDLEWAAVAGQVETGNVKLAAALGLRLIARDTARRGKWAQARVSTDAGAEHAIKLAESLETLAKQVDGVGLGLLAITGGDSLDLDHTWDRTDADTEDAFLDDN